jgi:hypothetical protein
MYDAQHRTLTYALAGHPPPIMIGVPGPEPLTTCASPPIGWGRPTGRRQTTVSLPAGSEVCFYSDGLIEARSDGELLGRERLQKILAGLGCGPDAGELLEQVRAAAEEAPDDMVACVLSPDRGAAGGLVRVEELEVGPGSRRSTHTRHFLELCGVSGPDIGRTVEIADDTAAVSGTAVIRVELTPAGARASVEAPGSRAPHARTAQGARSAGEPLLEAMVAG